MILVTGATGLLGSRVLYDLFQKGYHIRAMKRPTGRMNCLEHYFPSGFQHKRIEWVNGDLTDLFSLEEALRDVDDVYHCAGKVSFQPGHNRMLYHANVEGTANLVNICLEKNISKFCHVSSVAALGREKNENHLDESATWKVSDANSNYAISKYGAEREVWRGIAEGLNAVIVNPGVIIGPGNWRTDSSMLFWQVFKGLQFYTSGITGFVDVKDVSQAMIQLSENNISGERFIVVSENLPFRAIFDRIADNLNRPRPHIYAGKILSGLAWKMEWLRWKLTGSKPVITRETARSAQGKNFYSSDKLKGVIPFEFTPVLESIDNTSRVFLKHYQ